MKNIIRIMALMLCVVMMLGFFTACSDGSTADASSKASSKNTSSAASGSQNGDPSEPTSSTVKEEDPAVYADEIAYRASSANKQVKNLKILPVGDSLTYGSGTLSGWRYETFKRLYSAGITFEYVGPYVSSWEDRVGDRYNKHGGWSGRKIQDIIDYSKSIFNRDFDVVFLMIGYNDKADLGEQKKALYRSLIDKIYEYNSNATVFCMGIASDYGGAEQFNDFNKFIENTCKEMSGAGRATYYVSTVSDKWDPKTCFTDYVHFSEEGNAVVAECLTNAAIPVLQKMNVADTSYELPVSPSGITLDKSSLTLTAYNGFSQGAQLKATVNPTDAEVKNVVWGSSDRRVATVDENGTVRAVGAGTCTITACTLDGGKKATCTVTVAADTSGTVLFSEDFKSDANWSGSSIQLSNIKRNMYFRQRASAASPIATKATFDAGNKFYFSMDARVFRYNQSLLKITDSGYASVKYGNLEVRENKNGQTVTVLCDGNVVCEYNYGSFTVDIVEYGLLYDNGKVSLLRNGVEVATGTATANVAGSAVTVSSAEGSATVNFTGVRLVKF